MAAAPHLVIRNKGFLLIEKGEEIGAAFAGDWEAAAMLNCMYRKKGVRSAREQGLRISKCLGLKLISLLWLRLPVY